MKTKIVQVFSESAEYASRIERAVAKYCAANGFDYAPTRVAANGPYWFALDPIRAAFDGLADGDRLIYLDGSAYFYCDALTPDATIFADDASTPVRVGSYCESDAVRWNPRVGHPGAIAFVVGDASRAFVAALVAEASATRDRSPRSRNAFWRICAKRAGDVKIFNDYYMFAAKNGYFVRRLNGSTISERDEETARIFASNEQPKETPRNDLRPNDPPLRTPKDRDGNLENPSPQSADGTENESAESGSRDDAENVRNARADRRPDGTGTGGGDGDGTGTGNGGGTGSGGGTGGADGAGAGVGGIDAPAPYAAALDDVVLDDAATEEPTDAPTDAPPEPAPAPKKRATRKAPVKRSTKKKTAKSEGADGA